MKFKMNNKVKISRQKVDGSFNHGKIVGIELRQDTYYLGYNNEKEYLARFTDARYKVAYIDCFNTRAYEEWFEEGELE